MDDLRLVTKMFYRLFILSWILAVLWVKGYLWWVFAVAAALLLVDVLVRMSPPPTNPSRSQPAKSSSKRKASNAEEPAVGADFSWREPKPPWSAAPTTKP
jgi:hypothetical protein